MEQWTDTELDALGSAGELEISSRRDDGTLSPPVTIWAVRQGENVCVRSVNGPSATWYRAAQCRGSGRIRSGGVEQDASALPLRGDPAPAAIVEHVYPHETRLTGWACKCPAVEERRRARVSGPGLAQDV